MPEHYDEDSKRFSNALNERLEQAAREEEVKFAEQLAQHDERRRLRISLLSAFVGLITGAAALFTLQGSPRTESVVNRLLGLDNPMSEPTYATAEQLQELRSELTKLSGSKAAAGVNGLEGVSITAMDSQFKQLDQRIARLERAISDDPERALSIPMLRRDFDNLESRFDDFRSSVHLEVRSTQSSLAQLTFLLLTGAGGLIVTGLFGIIRFFAGKK